MIFVLKSIICRQVKHFVFSSASYFQAGETNQTMIWILNIILLHLGL